MTNSHPMFAQPKTALPYDGTTGSSAEGASTERADREAANGAAAQRQASILGLLEQAGITGLTYTEIADRTGQRGGAVTGALSSMHKEGLVAALRDERRNGCGVYVTPQQVLGRAVRPFGQNKPVVAAASRPRLTKDEEALLAQVKAAMRNYPQDRPSVSMKPSTVRTLVAAIDRLNG